MQTYTFIYRLYCDKFTEQGELEITQAKSYKEAEIDFQQVMNIQHEDIKDDERFTVIYECKELIPIGEYGGSFC